jgi:hypothetical protein
VGYQEHQLLTSQKDAVFEVVGAEGFDPSEFEWSSIFGDVYGGSVPCLIHTPTGSRFTFDFDAQYNNHCAEWSPGEQQPRDKDNAGSDGWPYMLNLVSVWLNNVRRERSSPNFWAQLNKQRDLLAASEPTSDTLNTPFSPEEQAEIVAQLNEIKQLLVNNYGADPQALASRIEQLTEASTRLGRRDWLNIFLGTLFGWALNGLVPPQGIREVLALASHTIGHLFGGSVPQLPM